MIVIIGAGIAGLSLGYALVKRGADVTVVDSGLVGGGASGVATSYLEPRLGQTASRKIEWEAMARWPNYAAVLEEETGIDVEFRTQGQLRVALSENLAKFERDLDARDAQGWPVERLSVEGALKLAPVLNSEIAGAAFLNNVRWVTGKKVCEALAANLRKCGTRVLEDAAVVSVESIGDGVRAMLSDGETLPGDKIIFCNGMGANHMLGAPDDIPKSRPVRGVNLVLDQSGVKHPIRHLIKHHRGNLCPRAGGRLIVGTTYEPDETSIEPDADVIEKLYANAEPVLPILRDLPLIEVTAGLRTKVGDGTLCLGRSAEDGRFYFSLSHAGAGFLRAPVAGEEMAEFVLNGTKGEFTGQFTRN